LYHKIASQTLGLNIKTGPFQEDPIQIAIMEEGSARMEKEQRETGFLNCSFVRMKKKEKIESSSGKNLFRIKLNLLWYNTSFLSLSSENF